MKKVFLSMIVTVIISIVSIAAIENFGYEKIMVNGGTIYGKISGRNKDLVVIIIAGSGPTDMNGNSIGLTGRNDSLLQLSRGLNEKGITTFRYDKRTAGRSNKTFETHDPNFDLLVDDCVAIIKHLRSKGYQRIVVAGHSEGAMVGLLAAKSEKVDGYISLAGTGNTIDVTLEKQLLRALGENSTDIEILHAMREKNKPVENKDAVLLTLDFQEYILSWMKHNPSEIIRQLNIPVLIVHGKADLQVDMEDFQLLKTNDSINITIEDMNHIMKKVLTHEENLASYQDPSFPLHEELIPLLSEFILNIY